VNPAGAEEKPKVAEDSWSEKIKTIGGLVAVVVGVLAVLVIAIVAMAGDSSSSATIASSAAGVIATIVGAYFGVKVGSDQTKNAMKQTDKAMDKQAVEATKAQVFAAHLPPHEAKDILALAEAAGRGVVGK
jgi:uncharacterized protein YacL